MPRSLLVLLLAFADLTILSQSSLGANFVVSMAGDTADGRCDRHCSLRDAILVANQRAGAHIVTLGDGVYGLTIAGSGEDAARTGDLDVLGELTITGAGSDATIIDAGALDRAFDVRPGAILRLDGLTIRNGRLSDFSSDSAGGAAVRNAGTLAVSSCILSANTAARGGAIFSVGILEVDDSILRDNVSTDRETILSRGGGAICIRGGRAVIRASAITGNEAERDGGGISLEMGNLTLAQVAFAANAAGRDGGALNVRSDATVDADRVVFQQNSARADGGAVSIGSDAVVTITRSTFWDNSASVSGGAVIVTSGGAVTIRDSTLNSNRAGFDGGGVLTAFLGSVTLVNTTLHRNGVGRTASVGVATGAAVRNHGRLSLTNCTISDSTLASPRGAVALANSGSAEVANTIIADRGPGPNCGGDALRSEGFNLDEDGTCKFEGTGDLSLVAAVLAPLSDYGGPTLTRPPCSGIGMPESVCDAVSPAIDGGNDALCPSTDQRGEFRPFGDDCDIGAVEVQLFPPSPSPSRTPTATPRPPRSPPPTPTLGPCYGDCSGDGSVRVDEIVRGVSIALGAQRISVCPVLDMNGDEAVTIDELVRAVNVALRGCASTASSFEETV